MRAGVMPRACVDVRVPCANSCAPCAQVNCALVTGVSHAREGKAVIAAAAAATDRLNTSPTGPRSAIKINPGQLGLIPGQNYAQARLAFAFMEISLKTHFG